MCIFCSFGVESNGKQCNLPCPIEHCLSCFSENGYDYCTKCEDGYDENREQTACVAEKEIEIPDNACLKEPGCKRCNSQDPLKCDECDTDNNWALDSDSYSCTCKTGFYPYENQCLNITTLTCGETADQNCQYCYNNRCIQCRYGNPAYYLINNQCLTKDSCNIANCEECDYNEENMNFYCEKCITNYIKNDDGVCVRETVSENCGHILGCSKCSSVDHDKCLECDSSKHFTRSTYRPGTCVCEQDYDFLNNQCVPPIPAVIRPETTGTTSITSVDAATDDDKVYKMTVDSSTSNLPIKPTVKEIIFNLNEPRNNNNTLEIKPQSDNTKITLECSQNANLVIPPSNKNININGQGEIQLDPPATQEGQNQLEEISIAKVIPEGKNDLKFSSTLKKLVLETIQVFGKSSISGDANEEHTTTCKQLNLEARSNFETKNVILNEVKIGLLSVLSLDKSVNVESSTFEIFYNRSTTEKQYPIQINNAFPNFTNAVVKVSKIAEKEFLLPQSQLEKLLIASFKNDENDYNKLKSSCEKLKSKWQGGADFGNLQCINDTAEPEKSVYLVAEKVENNDNKKKLSAGAIAGIVIACVAVVTIIIILLVYFLVIKKRNKSTKPAQDDSALEI